jgi:hypothetical protein
MFPGLDPVETGEVCFVAEGAADLCTPTGLNGAYALTGVPQNTSGAVRFTSSEVMTMYWVVATEAEDLVMSLATDTKAQGQSYFDQASVTPAAAALIVMGQVQAPVLPGWVATLDPATGSGPYYLVDGAGTIDVTATSNPSSDLAVAMFLNVDRDAGPISFKFDRDQETCAVPEFGGPLSAWSVPEDAELVFFQLACP